MTDAKRIDVHEALDEIRAQKEKLEEEIRTKTDACNNLKKAQNEMVTKFQELKLQSEKQAQELRTKSEELSTLSQLHHELKSNFQEKKSSVKHLNSAIDKIRYEYGEKIQKLERENKVLVLALEESTTNSQCLKEKVYSSNMEIEDLKRIILLKDKKLLEIAEKTKKTEGLTQRDEVIYELEEKFRDIEEQLKWKNEQFQHLEEAHKRLQDNFRSSKTEFEREKSVLLKEIDSLQTNLDSQTRKTENLQNQLRICNQSLAHEESTRKMLEVEISEYKSRFEDVFLECNEAKVRTEKLSHKRDEEVAALRDILAAKDSEYKEIGYKMANLEQENKDLKLSVKEFHESQIVNCGNTGSLKKLQKKYKCLEQVHKKCGHNLKEKEVEWQFELEKVRKMMDEYATKLKIESGKYEKNRESCNCLSEFHDEEISLVILILKSEFSVAYSDLFTELSKENSNLTKKCEEMKLLIKKVDDMKREQVLMEEWLAESSKNQTLLQEQIQVFENSPNQDDLLQKIVELEKGNLFLEKQIEILVSKANEQNEKIVDLQQQLEILSLKESQNEEKYLRIIEYKENELKALMEERLAESSKYQTLLQEQIRVLENSRNQDDLSQKFGELEKDKLLFESQNQILVSKTNDQNEKIVDLQQRLVLLTEAQNNDKEKYSRIIEDKENSIKNLLVVSEQEKKDLLEVMQDRDQKIEELEKELTKILMISEEKQIAIDVILEYLYKTENGISDLREKIKVKDELLLKSSQQFGDDKRRLENLVENLEVQNRALCEDIEKLVLKKDDLFMQMEITCEQIEEHSKDVELMGMLENMLKKSDAKDGVVNLPFCPLQKGKDGETVDARFPLHDLNK